MRDRDKTKDQLIAELAALRKQLAPAAGGAECDMAPSSPRWHSLVSNTPAFILILDRDHRICFLNQADFGESPDDMMGKTLDDLCLPEYRELVKTSIDRVFRTGEATRFDSEANRPKGQQRWYQLQLGPIYGDNEVVAVSAIAEDITERKHAEQEQARSRAMLKAIIECLPFDCFALGTDRRYILMNAVGRKSYPDAVGKTPEEVWPDEHDLAIWRENNQRAFSGERVEGEVELSVHGEKRHYHNVVAPICDGDVLYGILGVNIDITERHEAEAALQQARDELERRVEQRTAELNTANERLQKEVEERQQVKATLDAFFNASPSVLNIFDEEFRYLKVDGVTPGYVGLDAESILGKSLKELVPEKSEELTLLIQRVIETNEVVRDIEVKCSLPNRGGAIGYWEVSCFPVPLPGGKHGCGVVGFETTSRKLAEEALQQSHDELRAIYDRMVDGLLVADTETLHLVRANAAICRMLGYSEEELLSLSVRDIHPPELLSQVIEALRSIQKLKETPTTIVQVIRKDGSLFEAEVTSAPIIYNGKSCVLGIFRDTTERKQAEEAVERERRTLSYMLRASDHERQVIAYDIHDGLAQQLAAANMQFQLHEHLTGRNSVKARTAYDAGVEMVQQAHAEARRLINGVRPPILDESGVAAAIAHLVCEHSTPTGPKIEFHSGLRVGRLAKVLESAIYRIAQEALTNALQHSGSQKVRVSLLQEKDNLRVEIQDWGAGFDPQLVSENRFGLEGIRERTRLLGGQCSIESQPGNGACVRVILPILEREEKEHPPLGPPEAFSEP